ncbi:HNH endonuclease [Rhodococcus marinonascens]|uniref:HNH endonuclease n=1 Tax=Rhodococcus marinonascens TaxID=38311 RepID=UPI000932FB27|nr:HNH endonuclease [Rhodococcus marinonascens]
MRTTGFPAKVRNLIDNRADGACEVCGRAFWDVIHHRRPRRSGGSRKESTNRASNGIGVCSRCHDVIESRREDSTRDGLLISQFDHRKPAEIGAELRYGRVLLDDFGGIHDQQVPF